MEKENEKLPIEKEQLEEVNVEELLNTDLEKVEGGSTGCANCFVGCYNTGLI